ncbi:MAG: hypothetical protein HY078_03030 [Elusimicrobia bacterium]|nr:hypothetical protein [Elusimicrobiota bacterium]
MTRSLAAFLLLAGAAWSASEPAPRPAASMVSASAAPEAAAKVVDDLSVLPDSLLALLKDAGIRFILLKDGEGLLHSNEYKDLDATEFTGPAALETARRLAAASAVIEDEYAARLEDKRKRLLAWDEAVRMANGPGAITMMDYALRALAELAELRDQKYGKLDALAERIARERLFAARADAPSYDYGDRPGSDVDARILALTAGPKTLGDVAALRGARTPGEISTFCAATLHLNPQHFSAGAAGPEASLAALGGAVVIYPDYHHYPDPRGGRIRLLSTDYYDVRGWDETQRSRFRGEGLFSRSLRAVFLKESQAGAEMKGNKMAVHEAGHAFEEALRLRMPALHETLLRDSRAAYARAEETQEAVTPYASHSEQEFRAESFAAYFSPENRAKLESLDALWFSQLDALLLRAAGGR